MFLTSLQIWIAFMFRYPTAPAQGLPCSSTERLAQIRGHSGPWAGEREASGAKAQADTGAPYNGM